MVEGFDGKNVWITLSFKRHYKMCDECKHMDTIDCSIYFCSISCLKDFMANHQDKLDKFISDEVFWGKYSHLKQ